MDDLVHHILRELSFDGDLGGSIPFHVINTVLLFEEQFSQQHVAVKVRTWPPFLFLHNVYYTSSNVSF